VSGGVRTREVKGREGEGKRWEGGGKERVYKILDPLLGLSPQTKNSGYVAGCSGVARGFEGF
jgi:hypothetical protein